MKKIAIVGILGFFPSFALAANTLGGIINEIGGLIVLATPIVVALALLYFFFGLAKYILNSGDEEKKSEGRNIMIWGIIALFVMVSVWGLVRVLSDTFRIDRESQIVPPSVDTNPNSRPNFVGPQRP